MTVNVFCEKVLPPSFLVFLGFAIVLSLSSDAGASIPILLSFAVSLILLSGFCRMDVGK